jgi:hypothetical protein
LEDYDFEYSEEQEEKTEERERAFQIEKEDLRFILSTRIGRRFVWRLLENSGVFSTSFSSDALLTAFKEGNRNTGLSLLTAIQDADAEKYCEMLRESKEDLANGNN